MISKNERISKYKWIEEDAQQTLENISDLMASMKYVDCKISVHKKIIENLTTARDIAGKHLADQRANLREIQKLFDED